MRSRDKLLLLAFATALILSSSNAGRDEEDEDDDDLDESAVVVLTPKNFNTTIKKHTHVLVEFYAPWCGHCKQLKPHYAKAALDLKEKFPKGVVLAKIDTNTYKSVGKRFNVSGFPTLKWFVNGEPSEYTGGRTDITIVSWVQKRLGPATKHLPSPAEHDAFVSSAAVVVVGYFADAESERWRWFRGAAMDIDLAAFAHADSKAVHSHAGHGEGAIVLHKKFDGGVKLLYEGEQSTKALQEWLGTNSLPIVSDFSAETSSKIMESPVKTQVLLLADPAAAGYAALREAFHAAASAHYGRAVAVAVAPEHASVLQYFGVSAEAMPCAFAVRLPADGGKMTRYQGPAGPGLAGAVRGFFEDVIAGRVPPHRKSEPPPAEPVDEHGVTTLVGSTFEAVVMDATKDVLVEFYAPWCGHCKQLAPIYDELATELRDVPSVVIAKMDATANDPPEGTDIQGFPTIKFYQAGANKKGEEYEGERTVAGFRDFLVRKAGVPIKLKGKGKPIRSEL